MPNLATIPEPLQSQEYASNKQKERFEGFDFLRAIFSVAIVALKANLFILIEILFSAALAYALMAKVAYLAVPVFLQVSLFLFYLKLQNHSFSYFLKKRLPRLISLYLFWVSTKILFDLWIENGNFEVIRAQFSSPRRSIEFIISAGQSPFFFFFTLIFTSILAALLVSLFKKIARTSVRLLINYALLTIACLVVFSFSAAELIFSQFSSGSIPGVIRSISSIAFWDYNPLSFLPYIFTAAIVLEEFRSGQLRIWSRSLQQKLAMLLTLAVFFTILEWNLFDKLLHYSRLSLVFGSWFFLYLALISPLKAPSAIKFISACSLGIYCFHVFFTHFPISDSISFFKDLSQTMPTLGILASFAVTLIGSILLTLLFKQIKGLKNYV